jgi:predicted AlkP superfamily phosphohydrolase/phosphomutase
LTAAVALVLAAVVAVGCGSSAADPSIPRVIILGLDGMDHELTTRLMADGRLPGLSRLAETGGFAPLGTSTPPLSPVAWSDFITGADAGVHGVFDFFHRDPETMLPYNSTSHATVPERFLRLGGWQFPLDEGSVELLRRGEALWEPLEARGIPTTIVRIPANFPPSGTATREIAGMGTPDILGGYGTFSYYTTDRLAFLGLEVSGGHLHTVEEKDGVVEAQLIGPDHPLRVTPEPLTADFTVYLDPDRPAVKLVVGSEERILEEGEWSDWVTVPFDLIPTQTVPTQALFYLKQVRPHLHLYASPLNLDPLAPAMPISTPESFATELAEATGRYYTQGMPEDTGVLAAGVLTPAEFLEQAHIAMDEFEEQLPWFLDGFDRGLLFYYVGNGDLVSHMMWRPMDPGHPSYDAERDAPFADVVPSVYQRMDQLVSYTLDRMGDDTLLIVMSDHGFTSWRRTFHLNAWLHQNGYLSVKDESLPEVDGLLNVDWSGTRAYGIGLNGLYINVEGRERDGIVPPEEREALLAEIAEKLEAVIDPWTGQPAIARVFLRDETFADGGHGGGWPRGPDRQRQALERRPWDARPGRPRDSGHQPPPEAAGGEPPGAAGVRPGRVRDRARPGRSDRELIRRSRSMFSTKSVKLDKDLVARVKRYSEIAGYSSVEEFIAHALEKELSKLDGAASEEEIKT